MYQVVCKCVTIVTDRNERETVPRIYITMSTLVELYTLYKLSMSVYGYVFV